MDLLRPRTEERPENANALARRLLALEGTPARLTVTDGVPDPMNRTPALGVTPLGPSDEVSPLAGGSDYGKLVGGEIGPVCPTSAALDSKKDPEERAIGKMVLALFGFVIMLHLVVILLRRSDSGVDPSSTPGSPSALPATGGSPLADPHDDLDHAIFRLRSRATLQDLCNRLERPPDEVSSGDPRTAIVRGWFRELEERAEKERLPTILRAASGPGRNTGGTSPDRYESLTELLVLQETARSFGFDPDWPVRDLLSGDDRPVPSDPGAPGSSGWPSQPASRSGWLSRQVSGKLLAHALDEPGETAPPEVGGST